MENANRFGKKNRKKYVNRLGCEARDERWNVGQVQSHFLAVPNGFGMDIFMLGVCWARGWEVGWSLLYL